MAVALNRLGVLCCFVSRLCSTVTGVGMCQSGGTLGAVGVGVVEHCVWDLCEGVGALCGHVLPCVKDVELCD
jgi:hypothetical protein